MELGTQGPSTKRLLLQPHSILLFPTDLAVFSQGNTLLFCEPRLVLCTFLLRMWHFLYHQWPPRPSYLLANLYEFFKTQLKH